MRNRLRLILMLAAACGSASALVNAYSVAPRTAQQSGWTPQYGSVSEILTCCWDSLDVASGGYVELFAGAYGNGGAYNLSVWTYPDGDPVAEQNGGTYVRPDAWVRFDNITVTHPERMVKGARLEFKFTRSGSDSVQFYFSEVSGGGPYGYGEMLVGGQAQADRDLCMRLYSVMDTVTPDFFGVNTRLFSLYADSGRDVDAMNKAESLGIGWVRDAFVSWKDFDTVPEQVVEKYNLVHDRELNLLGVLCYGLDQYTTKPANSTRKPLDPTMYPPRGLWEPSDGANYWWHYVEAVLESLPSLQYVEVWNEAPACSVYFGNPDTLYYRGAKDGPLGHPWVDTPRERCSLYVRMCYVVKQVTAELDAGKPDSLRHRVIAGATYMATVIDESTGLSRGVEWIQDMLEIAENQYGGWENCFDAISVHPYQLNVPGRVFSADSFRSCIDTVKAVIRNTVGHDIDLMATEVGWNTKTWRDSIGYQNAEGASREKNADNLCELYTTALGAQAEPGGSYDKVFWYELTDLSDNPYIHEEGWGLFDSTLTQERKEAGFGCSQLVTQLSGKRLNGRVLTGDLGTDSVSRIYEFENPADSGRKTYVAWLNGSADTTSALVTRVAARTDVAGVTPLDYNGSQFSGSTNAQPSGWMPIELATRPVFLTEPPGQPLSRPDLVVDSLVIANPHPQVGSVMDVHVYVRNYGDSTPDTVGLDLLCNDSAFTHGVSPDVIDSNETCEYSFEVNPVPSWMHGWCLFSADVNPGQTYVEKTGLDDNAGYVRKYVSYSPYGVVDAVTPPGGKVNVPAVVFSLTGSDWDSDTTGATPPSEFRLIQTFYGTDTIADASDTTDWRAYSTASDWRFLHGAGEYRFGIQFKADSVVGPVAGDTSDSIVLFDTTAATGSFEVNSGARFTNDSLVTLSSGMTDNCAGLFATRFGDADIANVLKNPGMKSADGNWSFSSGGYDDTVGMALLAVSPDSSSRVQQSVPTATLVSLAGSTVRLEADVLVSVPGTDLDHAGELYLDYCYSRKNSSGPDTLIPVASQSFHAGVRAYCGLENVECTFELPSSTAPDSVWTWKDAYVGVRAQAIEDPGQVWVDNVGLAPIGPEPLYSDFAAYDSLTQDWPLAGGNGVKTVEALYLDSAGVENATPLSDTIRLDMDFPKDTIAEPAVSSYVSGKLSITGWAYDSVIASGDTWFYVRRMSFIAQGTTQEHPVSPDSVAFTPVYPLSGRKPSKLGQWNTTLVPNGAYWLVLRATDSAGNTSECRTLVIVSNGGRSPEVVKQGLSGEASLDPKSADFIGSTTGDVVSLDEDLDSLGGFTLEDSGQAANVSAVCVKDDTTLLAADATDGSVSRMTLAGGNKVKLVEDLTAPAGVATDARGCIWVLDKEESRLTRYDGDGNTITELGSEGTDSLSFDHPEAVFVRHQWVHVADTRNDRIVVYDTAGVYNRMIAGDFTGPTAVAVTDSGQVYAIDREEGSVIGINSFGDRFLTIFLPDSAPMKGLALTDDGLSLVTLRTSTSDILRLAIRTPDTLPGGIQSGGTAQLPKTLTLSQPWPNPARTSMSIRYALPKTTSVSLKVYAITGRLVSTLAQGESKPGYYTAAWDGRDQKGRTLAAGVYFVTLEADKQRINRKVVLTGTE